MPMESISKAAGELLEPLVGSDSETTAGRAVGPAALFVANHAVRGH